MPTAACPNCRTIRNWTSRRGSRLSNLRCPACDSPITRAKFLRYDNVDDSPVYSIAGVEYSAAWHSETNGTIYPIPAEAASK